MDNTASFFPPFDRWSGWYHREGFGDHEIGRMFTRFRYNFEYFGKLVKSKFGPKEANRMNAAVFVMCREMVRHEKMGVQLRPKASNLSGLMDARSVRAARCAGLAAGSIFFQENPDTVAGLYEYDQKIAKQAKERKEAEQAKAKQDREKKRIENLQRSYEKPVNRRKSPKRQSGQKRPRAQTGNPSSTTKVPLDSGLRKPMAFMGGERPRSCSGFNHPDFLHQ